MPPAVYSTSVYIGPIGASDTLVRDVPVGKVWINRAVTWYVGADQIGVLFVEVVETGTGATVAVRSVAPPPELDPIDGSYEVPIIIPYGFAIAVRSVDLNIDCTISVHELSLP